VLPLFAASGWGGVWVTVAGVPALAALGAGYLQLPDAQPAAGT